MRPQGDDGCGVVGFVVSAAILAVVGPAASFMGNFLLGMAANAAGQVASIAVGEQKDFNFRSAVLAGIGSGIGGALNAPGSVLNEIGNTTLRSMAAGAIGNLAVQHVATELGWQDHIDWRGVAAAGAAAGVSTVVGNALKGINAFEGLQNDYLIKVARASVSGFAAGATASLVAKGRIDAKQVALDAFGNALGSSFDDSEPDALKKRVLEHVQAGYGGVGLGRFAEYLDANVPNFSGSQNIKSVERVDTQAGGALVPSTLDGGTWINDDFENYPPWYRFIEGGPAVSSASFKKGNYSTTINIDKNVSSVRPHNTGDPIGYFHPAAIPEGATGVRPITMVGTDGSLKGGWSYELDGIVTNTTIIRGNADVSTSSIDSSGGTVLSGIPLTEPKNSFEFDSPASTPSEARSLSWFEGFTTFNPVGQAWKGYAYTVRDIAMTPVHLFQGAGNLVQDAYGYSKQAIFGPDRGIIGDVRPYEPQNGIIRSLENKGMLGTVGDFVSGAVKSLPGIGIIDALNRRDYQALGGSLAITAMFVGPKIGERQIVATESVSGNGVGNTQQAIPSSWNRFDPELNQAFVERLSAFGSESLEPNPGLRGGEGQLFLSAKAPDLALKRWYQTRVSDMAQSVSILKNAAKIVNNDPVLSQTLRVVNVREVGSDWILRDFSPDSIPLKAALGDEEVAAALSKTREALKGFDHPALIDLTKRLGRNPPSANFHWSPVQQKIIWIDGL